MIRLKVKNGSPVTVRVATGGKGVQGNPGPQGLPGLAATGAAEDVAALASYVRKDAGPNEFATELNDAFASRTLAALARPQGSRTVLMGDSLMAYNGGTSTATPTQPLSGHSSLGAYRWANVMLAQRLDIIGNSGIGGQESSQILARFTTDVLDLNPDIVAILAGTNDDGPEDETQANLLAMYEAALAAGVFVIAHTIPPQTSGALASYREGVNDWIKTYAATTPGVVLVDLADTWQDHDQAGFVARSDYLLDGTHPGTLGAQVAGRTIADALNPVLPTALPVLPNAAAPDNALTNPRFAGTGSATPTGWTATGSPSFSYIARSDGRPGQKLAVTVPYGGAVTLTQNVSTGVLLREGDDYDFTVTVEPYDLEEFGNSSQRINAFTQEWNGSTFSRSGDAVYIDGGAIYGSARFPLGRGVFRTRRATYTSGKTLAQVVITLFGGGTYVLSDPAFRNLTMIEAGLTSPEDVPHTNLIDNGTFETDVAGWSGFASAVVSRTTAQKRSGVASLQLAHTANVSSDARYQKTPVAAGGALNYVVWIKADAGFAQRLQFNYFGPGTGGAFLSTVSVPFTGTGDWQKLIGTTTAHASAGELLFAVARNDGGSPSTTPTVYVDDVDIWAA